jgi:hypothetical protein
MTTVLGIPADRIARVLRISPAEPTPEVQEPACRAAANDAPVRPKPDFTALESLPGYWLGRAKGRQAAVDFHRGEACQREITAGVDVSHDLLRDHQCIAAYEKKAGI